MELTQKQLDRMNEYLDSQSIGRSGKPIEFKGLASLPEDIGLVVRRMATTRHLIHSNKDGGVYFNENESHKQIESFITTLYTTKAFEEYGLPFPYEIYKKFKNLETFDDLKKEFPNYDANMLRDSAKMYHEQVEDLNSSFEEYFKTLDEKLGIEITPSGGSREQFSKYLLKHGTPIEDKTVRRIIRYWRDNYKDNPEVNYHLPKMEGFLQADTQKIDDHKYTVHFVIANYIGEIVSEGDINVKLNPDDRFDIRSLENEIFEAAFPGKLYEMTQPREEISEYQLNELAYAEHIDLKRDLPVDEAIGRYTALNYRGM